MDAADFFKMLVTTYKTTWCHNPEDHTLNFHRHEIPQISYNVSFCYVFIIRYYDQLS
jgi:hypothetical protein